MYPEPSTAHMTEQEREVISTVEKLHVERGDILIFKLSQEPSYDFYSNWKNFVNEHDGMIGVVMIRPGDDLSKIPLKELEEFVESAKRYKTEDF